MHLLADVAVVDLADGIHRFVGKRRQVGGGAVFGRLLRPLARRGLRSVTRVEHEDPAQRELRERPSGRADGLQFFHGAQARFVVDAGKRFADVERFAVAVELAVVARFELACRASSCR